MPSIHVVFYQEKEGDAPVVDWLKELRLAVPTADIKRALARKAAFIPKKPWDKSKKPGTSPKKARDWPPKTPLRRGFSSMGRAAA